MNQVKVGKFIAECRKDKKLTQAQLAEKLNMSCKSISKWETGRGMPDSSIMLELCGYLGITVNELLSGEHLKEEQYKEKANENIINIVKESDKNKKIKNRLIILIVIVFILLVLFFITKSIYNSVETNVEYDKRLIECKIEDDEIICFFKGISLVTFYSEKINTDNETLIFINGKMLLQNKIRSHFESWDSMARLNSGGNTSFNSQITINKNTDIVDCKNKIKIYYTKLSVDKIKNYTSDELINIIDQSVLIAEK